MRAPVPTLLLRPSGLGREKFVITTSTFSLISRTKLRSMVNPSLKDDKRHADLDVESLGLSPPTTWCTTAMFRRLAICAFLFACYASLMSSCVGVLQQHARDRPRASSAAFPDLYEASIAELQSGLESGLFTSVDLVKASKSLVSMIRMYLTRQTVGVLCQNR